MKLPKYIQTIILLIGAGAASFGAHANYVGTLKLPGDKQSPAGGLFTFSSSSLTGLTQQGLGETGYRLKLGYKYSRYLAIESEYVDFATNAGTVFASPTHLTSAFRQSGFGVDTVATVPVWRQFSFYGRLGAYTGARDVFSTNPVSLLGGEASRGTRMRYGLGMRYDFTKSLGVRAEMERYSPLGSAAGEPEADLFSVGLMWRF